MYQVKYAGPRPIISQHGITYKDGKEDKYIYLQIAIEILKDIDCDYENIKFHTHVVKNKELSQEQIDEILSKYENELEEHIKTEVQNYKEKIKCEIESVQKMKNINDIEKNIWIENINIMTDYRIQRAINKIYYMHCINDIKYIILKKRIKEIDTPFNEKFWHVLETIQGALESGKKSVSTKLEEVTLDNGNMIMKLHINI